MHRLRLLLRGLWWRRGLTLAVLSVAVVTTTAAALGPLYARAAAESILQDHLMQAGATTGIQISRDLSPGNAGAYAGFERQVRKAGRVHGYNHEIRSFFTPDGISVNVPRPPTNQLKTYLLWREGQCAQVVIVRGRCPSAPGEAMASERSVVGGLNGIGIGSRVALHPIVTGEQIFGVQVPTPRPLHVVGVYRPRNVAAPFWFGQNYFGSHGGQIGTALLDIPTIDPLLVTEGTFLQLPRNNSVETEFDYLLTPSAVRLNNVIAERQRMTQLLHDQSRYGLNINSGLLPVLQAAAHEHQQINTGTLLVILQLTLLAWLVLFQVVGNAVDARGDEIAMAKLRGYGPWATLRFGLGEPIMLLAIAVPVGLFAALGVAHLFAATVLVAGIPVLLTWSALATALIAFAGALVAVVLAAQRTLTRSVLDQWRHTERRPGHGALTLVIDALLAAAAVTGLVVLLRTPHAQSATNTTALLAPALLVFAVGIIGVRLLPLVARRLATATRGTRRVGLFFASCQVARRPVGLRLAALLAVAIGLATFGVAGETVTSANRAARADAEIGATRVVGVQFAPGLDPIRATHAADPAGRWAMPAATWLPDGGQSVLGTVLGVDPTRLATVAAPVRGGLPNDRLAGLIRGNELPPINLHATALRVDLTAAQLRGNARPVLQINLRSARTPYLNIEGAAIQPGAQRIVVRIPCASGCLFRGLTWDRPITATTPTSGTITVHGLAARRPDGWQALALQLTHPTAWYAERPQGQASDHVRVTPSGVVDQFSNRNGGYGGVTYAADPVPMPAVATPAGIVRGAHARANPFVTDADSVNAAFAVRRTVPLLPLVEGDGVVMSVRALENELPAFAAEATWSVWLGPDAPADYRHRLADAGLQIVSQHSLAERRSQLARQAPALALLLLLVCALAGAVLAVGGTAISISASSRRRSYELAALRVVGVGRPSLLRAGVIEQLLLLGTAVVLGVPAGYIAARLAMPIIPEFSDRTPVKLTYTPHAVPTAVFAAALVVLLVLTALVAAQALIRVAVPARLREAE